MADQFAAVPYDIKASYEKVSARIQVCRKWADTLSVDLCKNNGRGVPQEPIGIANVSVVFSLFPSNYFVVCFLFHVNCRKFRHLRVELFATATAS